MARRLVGDFFFGFALVFFFFEALVGLDFFFAADLLFAGAFFFTTFFLAAFFFAAAFFEEALDPLVGFLAAALVVFLAFDFFSAAFSADLAFAFPAFVSGLGSSTTTSSTTGSSTTGSSSVFFLAPRLGKRSLAPGLILRMMSRIFLLFGDL